MSLVGDAMTNLNEDLRGLRTTFVAYTLAGAAALVGAYDLIQGTNADWHPLVPDRYRPFADFGIPVMFAWLRKITTGPEGHIGGEVPQSGDITVTVPQVPAPPSPGG